MTHYHVGDRVKTVVSNTQETIFGRVTFVGSDGVKVRWGHRNGMEFVMPDHLITPQLCSTRGCPNTARELIEIIPQDYELWFCAECAAREDAANTQYLTRQQDKGAGQ